MQTYAHDYHGVESVASATVQSDNTVYARLSLDVGPENIVAMARKLGIRTSPLQAVPSLALGTIGVTPLEMASAYATLAAGGVYSKPMAITKVVLPNGKADTSASWGKPQRERVIPDWVASTVTQVLEQNMLYGTGTRRARLRTTPTPARPARPTTTRTRGSTATRPRLQAAVWIGYPSGEIPMLNVHGIAVSGPTFPAQIWHSTWRRRSATGRTLRSRRRRRRRSGRRGRVSTSTAAPTARTHGDHASTTAATTASHDDEPCAYDDGCVGADPPRDDVRAPPPPSTEQTPTEPPPTDRRHDPAAVERSTASSWS